MADEWNATLEQSTDWLSNVLADRKKRVAIKRASTFEDFKNSWSVAALLGQLKRPKYDRLLAALWGAATAKKTCDGSLASIARQHGVNERRWRKLISTRDREEAARQVRRIVRQLDAAPVGDIIDKLYWWGPDARQGWAVAWFDSQEGAEDDS